MLVDPAGRGICRSSRSTSCSATPRRGQGVPRRAAGSGDLLVDGGVIPTAAVRHAGRRDGLRLWRAGGLRDAGAQDRQAPLDKSSRFTDWSRRPLSDAQKTYALADVTHLRDDLRVSCASRLEEIRPPRLGRGGAGGPDRSRDLCRRARGGLDAGQDAHQFAASSWPSCGNWRGSARSMRSDRNVPRSRVIKDDALLELASTKPQIRDRIWAGRGCCCARRARARSPTASSRRCKAGLETPADRTAASSITAATSCR